MRFKLVALAIVLSVYPVLIHAQEGGNESEIEKNSIELFLGGTHADEDTDFSIGLEYERRLSQAFGIGGLVEYTHSDEFVFAVPVFFHATETWKVFLAPGLERADDEDEFLVRVGTAYEFEMGSWTLAPELNFDFVGGEVKTVFGLSFGSSF